MKGIKDKNIHLLETFIEETYNHYKPILLYKYEMKNLKEKYKDEPGVLEIKSAKEGLKEMEQMRFWDRNIAK